MKKLLSFLLAVILVVGITNIMATAESANQAYLRVGGLDKDNKPIQLDVIVTEGGAAKYMLSDENGAATYEGASEENYHLKFEYPTGGPATIYLKGANLKTQENFSALEFGTAPLHSATIRDFDVKVFVEEDSTLTGLKHHTENDGYSAINFANSGAVTITGPGKLNLYSTASYCITTSSALLIKHANIYAEVSIKGNQRPVIWVKENTLTIDNSNVELKNGEGGACLYNSAELDNFTGEACDMIVKNNSKLKISVNSYRTAVQSTGTFKIDNSEVEIIAKGQCFNVVPEMEGVGAVGGTKAGNAEAFDAKKAKDYAYFKCGPDVVPPTTAPSETIPSVTHPAIQATESTKTTETTQAATQATQVATQTTQAATQATQGATNATQNAQVTQPVDKNKEGNGNIFIIIAIIIVLLAGVGMAVFMIIQDKKYAAEDAEDEEEAEAEAEAEVEVETETTENTDTEE